MSGDSATVFPLGASVAGRRYLVYGLARSGLATVDALFAAGARVVAWDENEAVRSRLTDQLIDGKFAPDGTDASFMLANPSILDLESLDAIIVSPGVPINRHPIAAAARAANVPLIGDIELFALARPHLPPHKVVGITGTNGKSTTTALVHHILKVAGVPTTMGGNIGIPILSQPELPEGGVYVLELSSYQIDLTFSLDCDVAVLLNITPDHLDRYESFAAYAAAKARLFEMQSPNHWGIVSHDDAPSRDVTSREIARRSHQDEWESIHNPKPDRQHTWPALQGPHNAFNATAAIHACLALGLEYEAIDEALRTYPGLPHRMERIADIDGVLYVNDSKATNAASAAPALAAYPPAPTPRIHWIVGGMAKSDGVGECEPLLGNVKHAWLIGDAAPMLERSLAGRVPLTVSGTMDAAIAAACAAAQPGDVVLLSPAAASFDQFRDFEHRGDHFRDLVHALTAGEAQP